MANANKNQQREQTTQTQNKPSVRTLRNRRRRNKRRVLGTPRVDSEYSMYAKQLENLPNQTRTGRRPNPADPRTVLAASLGSTPKGACAALKMLHPCGEYDLSKVKIPDGAVSTSVSLERRDEYEIPVPGTQGSATSWTCLVVHHPFLTHRDTVLRWPNSVSPSETIISEIVGRVLIENIYQVGDAAPTCAIYPTFKTASSLTGEGQQQPYASIEYSVLTSATLTPAILASPTAISSLTKDLRRTACGYTTDLDASNLYNQGRVISGQWSPSITLGTNDQHTNVTSGDTTVNVVADEYDTYVYTLPAFSTSTIVSSDMFRRQAEAKYGSYMPIRLCTPKVDFTACDEYRQIQSTDSTEGDPDDQTGNRNAYDVWLRGWSVGVELWLNLDPHAELRMKVVEDLEVTPAPTSTFSPFMSPGYPQDDRAMSVVREFSRISPHAYDADFNRLNKLATNLLNGLAGVVSNLGIPLLSSIAKPGMGALMDKYGYKAQYQEDTGLD